MEFIADQQIENAVNFEELTAESRSAFQGDLTVPMRHHHDYANRQEGQGSTLL